MKPAGIVTISGGIKYAASLGLAEYWHGDGMALLLR